MYGFHLRPDFMSNQLFERSYLSNRMLGLLYRNFMLIEKGMSSMEQDDETFDPWDENYEDGSNQQTSEVVAERLKRSLIIDGWQEYRAEAEEAYLDYLNKMREIIDQLGLENETVVLSDVYDNKMDAAKETLKQLQGHFQDKFQKQCQDLGIPKRRFKRKKKKKAIQGTDAAGVSSVVEDDDEDEIDEDVVKSNVEEEEDDDSEDSDEEEFHGHLIDDEKRAYYRKPHQRHKLISAWYAISFDKMDNSRFQLQGKPVFGLPWLIDPELAALARFVWYRDREARMANAIGDVLPSKWPHEEIELSLDEANNRKLIEGSFTYQALRELGLKWFEKVKRNIVHRNTDNRSFEIGIARSRAVTEDVIMRKLIEVSRCCLY